MKKEFLKIPNEIVEKYSIDYDSKTSQIFIHEPAFISIRHDAWFKIINYNERTTIENSKLLVNLWKNIKMMHCTVF